MNEKQLKSVPIFEIKKKHAWKGNVLRTVEKGIILIVFLGTIVWVIFSFKLPFNNIWNNFLDSLKPKVSETKQVTILGTEEKIKLFFEKEKILEVNSIAKTPEGDYQVTTKQGTLVFFDNEKDIDQQLLTLQTLITKAKIDNKSLKRVDFRFSKIIEEF